VPRLDPSTLPAGERAEAKLWLKDRNKFTTGFCNNFGKTLQCEGTKASSHGVPLKTCPKWLECPCECHYRIDKIFKMTGMERQEMPNPEFIPTVSDFVMPAVEEPVAADVAATPDGVTAPPAHEHAVAATDGPSTAPLAERRTPTGRAARGGLEAQVWEACRAATGDTITPKLIGEMIAEKYTIPTPSSGAINAVWDRWSKLGFATQAKKPNRFTGFTGEGTWEELARMKSRAKTAKRSQASAARRGFRQ